MASEKGAKDLSQRFRAEFSSRTVLFNIWEDSMCLSPARQLIYPKRLLNAEMLVRKYICCPALKQLKQEMLSFWLVWFVSLYVCDQKEDHQINCNRNNGAVNFPPLPVMALPDIWKNIICLTPAVFLLNYFQGFLFLCKQLFLHKHIQ